MDVRMLVESELLIETKNSKWEIPAIPVVCQYHPNDVKKCNHLDNPTKNCIFTFCPIKINTYGQIRILEQNK
jgi:hypothetical protein